MLNDSESAAPDRIDRWNAFWDLWSRTLPPEASEVEYADLTMEAWEQFEKQDAAAQAAAIAKAWGIAKTIPKRRCRKPPVAVVIPPTPRWEPCAYWCGEPCLKHKHAKMGALRAQGLSVLEHFLSYLIGLECM